MGFGRFRIIAAVLAVGTAACGEDGPPVNYPASKPAAVFPSRAELSAIPEKKVTAEEFDLDNVQVESWNYDSASAVNADGPYEDPSPWNGVLTDMIRILPPGQARLSAPLRCAAEQVARFHLKHNSLPSQSWRRFTVARCGSPVPFASASARALDIPAGVTEAQLTRAAETFRAEWAPKLATIFGAMHRPVAAAMATVREGNRFEVGFVFAADTVQVDAGSFHADARRLVRVRGALRGDPVEAISGLVSRGKYGVSQCVSDQALAPPNFSLLCEIAEGDKWAWVDVLARPHDRVLVNTVGHLLVSAAGENLPAEYTAPRGSGAPAPVRSAVEFRSALIDRLNGVRSSARLAPLALSVEQSTTTERLAGIVLDTKAAREGAPLADRAAVGLLAGWDVRGLIRNGNLYAGAAPSSHDATVWLDYALETPLGRLALLDPDSRVAAIGPVMPDSVDALGAVVTTYSLFENANHDAEAGRVFSAITGARVERGLPAPVRVLNVPQLTEELTLVRAEKKTPGEGLHEVLTYMASRLPGVTVQGFLFETVDVEHLKLPEELFAAGPMQVAVEVTHHRAQGAAWGQYVVYVMAMPNFGGIRPQ